MLCSLIMLINMNLIKLGCLVNILKHCCFPVLLTNRALKIWLNITFWTGCHVNLRYVIARNCLLRLKLVIWVTCSSIYVNRIIIIPRHLRCWIANTNQIFETLTKTPETANKRPNQILNKVLSILDYFVYWKGSFWSMFCCVCLKKWVLFDASAIV